MRNALSWQPTKYVRVRRRLRATSNRLFLAPQSRIVADLVAEAYFCTLPKHVRGSMLDVGCGLAPLYGEYSRYSQEIVTADWPMSHHSHPHTDFFLDLNEGLPLGDCTFDTVLMSDVLEHVKRPELVWAEVSRVLRPAGKFIGNTPFLYPIHEEPYDYFRYTEFALKDAAERAGLRLLELVAVGGYVELIGDLLAKGVAQGGALGRAVAAVTAKLVLSFSRTSIGARVRTKSSFKFPLGYLFVAAKANSTLDGDL